MRKRSIYILTGILLILLSACTNPTKPPEPEPVTDSSSFVGPTLPSEMPSVTEESTTEEPASEPSESSEKPTFEIIVTTEPTEKNSTQPEPTEPTEPSESEVSTEQPTQPSTEPTKPDDTTLLKAIQSIGVRTIAGKSLLCYSTGNPSAVSILTIVNQPDGTAVKTEYVYYQNREEYEQAAGGITEGGARYDTLRLLKLGSTPDDPVGDPVENLYVALFGYALWVG